MKLGNRYSQHSFATVPDIHVPRSAFDRSFASKTTFDFDYLIPFFVDEILPGDTVNLNVNSFIRLASQAVPVMDNMYVDFYFFFVPNRLTWDNWEKFMGAQTDPDDSIDYEVPHIAMVDDNFDVGTIYDQLGLATNVNLTMNINCLPLRGYYLIWNSWFRDQNLQDSLVISKSDGPDSKAAFTLKKGNKKHDYFTSCLPWPQKGDPVTLPLTGTAPIVQNGPLEFHTTDPSPTPTPRYDVAYSSAGAGALYLDSAPYNSTNTWYADGLETDFNNADITTTMNQFRMAIMTQSFLENDARGGTRYVEILRSHFNVISPDFRLQRPEFLSGGTISINQNIVAQTSETTENSPQGNLAAFSTSANLENNIGFSKSFVEHGYVIGLCKARADITYQQGINRMWTRADRLDFFWPEFQQLGEQPVYKYELFAKAIPYTNTIVGYQERHAEYRYRPSEIKGQFRSTYTESLDVWHLAQEFESEPELNSDFITLNTPIERVLEVTEGYPHLKADFWFNYKHIRPMIARPRPASLGRF